MVIAKLVYKDPSKQLLSSEDETIKIPVKPPFNFALHYSLNLRGQIIPLPYVYSETSWRCIIRGFSGKSIPVDVFPNRSGGRTYLVVRILSDYSSDDERELRRRITQVFCPELDLLPFYKKSRSDVKFYAVIERLEGLKPYLSQDPFEALIKAVVRQVIRADSARASIEMLVLRFGSKRVLRGESYYGFPSPEALSRAPKNELIKCRVGYKWKLIKKLSNDVVSGDLDLYALMKHDDRRIIERLMEYCGIGYWTSRIFLYDGLKRLDAYPILDISLRKAISLMYFSGKPIPWEEVESFFKRYKEFVGVATNYLFGVLWLERCSRIGMQNWCNEKHYFRKIDSNFLEKLFITDGF